MRRIRLSPRLLTILSILVLSIGASWTANAQTKTEQATDKADASAKDKGDQAKDKGDQAKGKGADTTTPSALTPIALSIKKVKVNGKSAGLNDEITVVVENLDEEIARQENPDSKVAAADRLDPHKLVLFLNNIEMTNLFPTAVARGGELTYRLTRDASSQASRDAWLNFLAAPDNWSKTVNASVALAGKTPPAGQPFTLRLYNKNLFYTAAILFLLTFIGFLFAARKTTIIRDSGPPNPAGGPIARPYSLGRAQMAWWFFIILGSYLFITLSIWDLDTITTSSLVLLGIGTGTALGAAMVDANKSESSKNDLATLLPQKATLEGELNELTTKIADAKTQLQAGANPNLDAAIAALQTQLATKATELQQLTSQVNDAASGLDKPVSEGIVTDLLSDVNGVTVHRFQICVWTIVLGVMFLYLVWKTLAMPQFSDTTLALMGISAGTFIGFKIPEKQTKPGDAAAGGGQH